MKPSKYIMLALLAMLLCACTRNDGDIGRFFGQWKLVGITRGGVDDTSYKGNMYWSFQNSTIEMKEVTEDHVSYQTFGNWHEADNTLFLSFPDKGYAPSYVTGLPREAELQIMQLDGGAMVLSYGDPATIYTFKKW